MNVKKYFGLGVKVVIGLVVIAFLGLKSLDFFYFTTPADEWYYAWLGFGLTGGGVIAYLVILLFDSDTPLKKTISIVMLFVCLLGEVVTAGYGLQVNAWKEQGLQMQADDFASMVIFVQLLGFLHGIALIAYVAGDTIRVAFGDEDGDGIPNIVDPDYKKGKKQNPQQEQFRAMAAEIEQLKAKLSQSENPTDGQNVK
jgi:hypothetical protein